MVMTIGPSLSGSGEIGRAVLPAEATWKVRSDLPFFDTRLIVDTCAQFVAASFQIHAATGDALDNIRVGSKLSPDAGNAALDDRSLPASPASRGPQSWGLGSSCGKRGHAQLKAIVAHGHGYVGAERLALELVLRCAPLKEQLRQTARPLCRMDSDSQAERALEYEVNRFLKSRLVSCDLSDLLSYDCFTEDGEETMLKRRTRAVTLAKKVRAAETVRDRNREAPHWSPDVEQKEHTGSTSTLSPTKKDDGDDDMEVVMQRFQLRFWRVLATGIAVALFGSENQELVARFEASAQHLFRRYDGQLSLAMNSLMGWLPAWISDSLFVAFVGLGAGVAVRQCSEKYAMLQRCLRPLADGGGRYIFLSTPGWYAPLASWIPCCDRSAVALGGPKRKPGERGMTFHSTWAAACFQSQECIEAMDDVWAGRIPGRRGALQLLPGFESLSMWVLRMTLGCERLFSLAVQVVRQKWAAMEEVYDENKAQVEDMMSEVLPLSGSPADFAELHALVRESADLMNKLVDARQTELSMEARLNERKGRRASKAPGAGSILQKRRNSGFRRPVSVQKPPRRGSSRKELSAERRGSASMSVSFALPVQFRDSVRTQFVLGEKATRTATSINKMETGDDEISEEESNDGVDEEDGDSLLAQLHADTQGVGMNLGGDACKLRRFIHAGGSGKEAIRWPLGQPGAFGGRIPIHDSPELLPTAPPPAIEDTFTLPEAAGAADSPDASAAGASRLPLEPAEGGPASDPYGSCPGSGHGRRPQQMLREVLAPRPRLSRTTSAPLLLQPPMKLTPEDAMRMMDWSQPKPSSRRGPRRGRSLAPTPAEVEAFRKADGHVIRKELSDVPRSSFSAPPAVDSSDFDVGDPLRNTVVTLALQNAVRDALVPTTGADGPLFLAFRHPQPWEHSSELQRVRLCLGALLLFAACRTPLPVWSELPLRHFTCIGGGRLRRERNRLELQKANLPDCVLISGCTPLFNCMPSNTSAEVSPHMAGSFVVGVPHAFLEHSLVEVLAHRTGSNPYETKRRWSEGSMLALLMSASCLESFATTQDSHVPVAGMQQDHCGICKLFCVFHIVLGFELVNIWHEQLPTASDVTLEQFFPFLQKTPASCRRINARVAMVSDGHNSNPLIQAPWVASFPRAASSTSATKWRPTQLYPGPLNEPVSLKAFATWVKGLEFGHLVYSSRHSKIGDLYLRASGAVVVIAFCDTTQTPAAQDIWAMYDAAVGEPQWWDVHLVSYILFPFKLHPSFEPQLRDVECAVFSSGMCLDGKVQHGLQVKPGSEVIVCSPRVLDDVLGSAKSWLLNYSARHEAEIVQQTAREERLAGHSGSGGSHSRNSSQPSSPRIKLRGGTPRKLPAGAAHEVARRRGVAAQYEARPQQLPASSLEQNAGLLAMLLEHTSSQVKRLFAMCQLISDIDGARLREGMPGVLDEQARSSEPALSHEESIRREGDLTAEATSSCVSKLTFRRKSLEEQASSIYFAPTVYEPQRSERRKFWRPWTPHPRMSNRANSPSQDHGPHPRAAIGDFTFPEVQSHNAPTEELHPALALPFDFLGMSARRSQRLRSPPKKNQT